VSERVDLYTMCVIRDGDKILLLNRTAERGGFPGYLAPGGKVDFPESIVEAAAREVREETGLEVHHLVYKGLDEYVNPQANHRYMVFNYYTDSFEGHLLEHPPEGELKWVPMDQFSQILMQEWFRRRLPLFFEEGTFEIHAEWDEESNREVEVKVRKT
jgi:8-oxo-dGTP diphosphatase